MDAIKKKILIIEDTSDVLDLLKDRFIFEGYDVITAVDGKEGLETAQKQNPDLIILDIMLPKVDGYKVCGLLKADTRFRKIPIIMFTARFQKSDKDLAKEVGADLYFDKTSSFSELSEAVQKFIGA